MPDSLTKTTNCLIFQHLASIFYPANHLLSNEPCLLKFQFPLIFYPWICLVNNSVSLVTQLIILMNHSFFIKIIVVNLYIKMFNIKVKTDIIMVNIVKK